MAGCDACTTPHSYSTSSTIPPRAHNFQPDSDFASEFWKALHGAFASGLVKELKDEIPLVEKHDVDDYTVQLATDLLHRQVFDLCKKFYVPPTQVKCMLDVEFAKEYGSVLSDVQTSDNSVYTTQEMSADSATDRVKKRKRNNNMTISGPPSKTTTSMFNKTMTARKPRLPDIPRETLFNSEVRDYEAACTLLGMKLNVRTMSCEPARNMINDISDVYEARIKKEGRRCLVVRLNVQKMMRGMDRGRAGEQKRTLEQWHV